jgi:hypothetical protein
MGKNKGKPEEKAGITHPSKGTNVEKYFGCFLRIIGIVDKNKCKAPETETRNKSSTNPVQ